MKEIIKIAKNMSLNMLRICMFIPLWSMESDHSVLRISFSFIMAGVLAVFQFLFEEKK